MRSIAILNQKGGVAKRLSASFKRGAGCGRTASVSDDMDRSHASLHLGLMPGPSERSIYHVLTGDTPLADVRTRWRPTCG